MIKLLWLLLLPACTVGQYNGRVLDSASKKPLPFATVRLLKGKRILQTTLTDSLGRFRFDPAGVIQVSMIGYRTAIFYDQRSDYFLQSFSTTLSTVMVVAQRPLITTRVDGFSYDATQDVPMAGENTSDLLRRLPGVQVDPDGIPSMRGSRRIKVFIDGKPSEAYAAIVTDALRMIPAGNIVKIDIITQPSARYEGEGVDGVLLIFTRRLLSDGSSGNVNGYYQNRSRLLTGSIALRRRQWVFRADAGYSYYNTVSWSGIKREDIFTNTVDQYLVRANRLTNLNTGLGVTYLPDTLTTISADYRYGQGWDNIFTDIDYDIKGNSFSRHIDNPYDRSIHPLNWNYIRKSKDRKREFNFLGNWFNQHLESDYVLRQSGYKESNFNTTWNKELALESNYIAGGFEAGVKASFRRYRNTSVFIPEDGRSQDFRFPRDIYGAYVSQTFVLKKYKVRLGARYEHTVLLLDFRDTSIRVPDY